MTGGFQVQKSQGDGDYTGKLFTYDVDAGHGTLLSPGDVMRITGTADADGRPGVDAATAGQSITGILDAVAPIFAGEQLSETGLPAGTGGTVQLLIDPMRLFKVDVSNGPLLVTEVGLNADIVATAATKTGGLTISNMTLNATGVATTQALPFRIVQLLEDEAGVLGNVALVRPNNTTLSDGATGV